jgi:Lactate racemase N-terminal domain
MSSTDFPEMVRIRQTFATPEVDDIHGTIVGRIEALDLSGQVSPGQTVAVALSSRGIANYAEIVRALVASLKQLGLKPFLFPAMGSHGGASAEGQQQVLEHYGLTPEGVGAPIRSSLEVVEIGKTEDGLPVYLDKIASQADHIVLVNRIKKHTDFTGRVESGLMKLMAIGVGKQTGAFFYHRAMISHGYERVILTVGRTVLEKANILCGVGIVENAALQTAALDVFPAAGIEAGEMEMLKLAKSLAPTLPCDEADILFVQEMGKEISGSGIDTKVVGRIGLPLITSDPERPDIKIIVVSDLTDHSDGNAVGVGLADLITRRLRDKIDRPATDINTITGVCPLQGKIPVSLPNDREALSTAIKCVGLIPVDKLKIVRIRNTARLEEVEMSAAYLPELENRDHIQILGGPRPLEFNADGYLNAF